MGIIPSAELSASDIPGAEAPLREIRAFSRTFDGYAHWGSFQQCAEVANARDHTSLDRLRTCLFFEVRRWNHFGAEPDAKAEAYWRMLVSEIERHVRAPKV